MTTREMLRHIATVTGWTQEELASKLSVSFPTLNSWINGKSNPRVAAIKNIESLYISTIGADDIDRDVLTKAKAEALELNLSPSEIVKDKNILNNLTLHLTYHTNTIEGSTMTLSDVKDVIFDNKVLANRTAIEQVEARNHQATLHWLLDQINQKGDSFQVDEALIKDIHIRLMNGIVTGAGIYRKHSVRIMGSQVSLTNWQKIHDSLHRLVNDSDKMQGDSISLIAHFHAKFEQIHPFSDGNGRTGRLLMLAQALSKGLTPPIVARERKQAYYKYLELAQTKKEFVGIELFVAESIMYANTVLNRN